MHRRVLDPCTIIRVRTWDIGGGAPERASAALNIVWPTVPEHHAYGRAEVVCIAPADWLVLTAESGDVPVLKTLNDAFNGSNFRATDVSCSFTRIQVRGEQAWALLAKGCSLDVAAGLFPMSRSASTRFAGMPVIVRCAQPSLVEYMVATSYRDYLSAWLEDAAVEFAQ